MHQLVTKYPELDEYLCNGGFSTQLSNANPFHKIPLDQTVEEIINKDAETARGTKGYSLKASAVAKYSITSEYQSSYVRMMRKMAKMQHKDLNHPDLRPSRTKRDEGDVKSLIEMLKYVLQNSFFLEPQELFSISTGASPCEEAISYHSNAQKITKRAYNEFIRRHLLEDHDTQFFDTLPCIKLRSFETKARKSAISKSRKEVILKADRNLFTMMTVVVQMQQLDMKNVLTHSLGSIPWSLATSDGSLRKTKKVAFSAFMEKLSPPAECLPDNNTYIFGAMSIVQK